jgi:hypothetical protein
VGDDCGGPSLKRSWERVSGVKRFVDYRGLELEHERSILPVITVLSVPVRRATTCVQIY